MIWVGELVADRGDRVPWLSGVGRLSIDGIPNFSTGRYFTVLRTIYRFEAQEGLLFAVQIAPRERSLKILLPVGVSSSGRLTATQRSVIRKRATAEKMAIPSQGYSPSSSIPAPDPSATPAADEELCGSDMTGGTHPNVSQ